MRILVLGGTSFVGRAIVADALGAGAEVTIFGRGKTGAGLFPRVPRRIGDRDTGDYTALRDGSWDAVVDVSGYVPRHVGQAMDMLGDQVGRYLFIPLIRPESMWVSQQRSPARARAAGLPATPLAVTAADVLAWDRERGEPPLRQGLSPAEEAKLLGGA
jgi:NAD(P)-dependent dehydrogenase (short-subunit alcohol dehydrogenase family)